MEENTIQTQEPSFGVYPPILRIKAGSEAHVTTQLHVLNNSKSQLKMDISLRAFEADEKNDGSVQYYTTKDTPKQTADFLNTVKLEDNGEEVKAINLSPKDYKTLTLVFTAPKENSQNYYFSVIFTTQTQETKTEDTVIRLSSGVATNVLVSVNQNQNITGEISEFTAKKFILNGPVTFKLTATNTNDNFTVTTGTITVYDTFGNKSAQIALKPAIILSNSSRIMEIKTGQMYNPAQIIWNNKFLLGFYTAKANVSFDKTYTASAETHFVAIPLLFLLVVTIIFMVVLSIILRTIKKLNFKEV